MPAQTLPLFYKQPRALLADRDGDLSLLPQDNYIFASETNSVPLLATEFIVACKHFPILFAEGPHAQPVALLGVRSGTNLFVDDQGRWEKGAYIPAYVRRYPFVFFENEDQSQFTLCIDEASAFVVPGRDNPFFIDGKPGPVTENALGFLREFQMHQSLTTKFLEAVKAADLLVENRADITLNQGEKLSLSGFKVIDENKFNQLPVEELVRWREEGWLALAYAHFISMSSWAALIDRAAVRIA